MNHRDGSIQKIDEILAHLIARRGYGQTMVTEQLENAWSTAVGDSLASHSRPGKIRKGVLDVVATNSTVVQELTFSRRQILKQLTELAPDLAIKDLRIRVA